MSGPKVVRIVTREEMEKRCQVQISRLEKAINKLKAFAEKQGGLDEKLAADLDARLARFKNMDSSQYTQIENEIPAQIKFLKTSRKKIEKAIEKKAATSRRSYNNLLRIRKQLIEQCATEGIAVPEALNEAPSSLFISDEALEKFRSLINQAQSKIFSQLEQDKESLSEQQQELSQRLATNLQTLSFTRWRETIDSEQEPLQISRLNTLLSQLKVLEEDDDSFSGFITSVNELFENIVDPYITMRCDSLILELSEHIEQSKELAEQREVAEALLLETEEYISDANNQEYQSLKAELQSCNIETIASYIERATAFRDLVRDRFEGASRRRVMLQGLADLGYEVNENLETAWVEQGSLVVAKNEQDTYGIELVGNESLDRCQVRVVGSKDRNQSSDKEAEETWCEDFAAMRKAALQNGSEISIQKSLLPGQSPLKAYSESDDRWKKRAGVGEKKGKYLH